MKISINKLSIILGLGVGTIIGCQPEEFGNGNGLVSAPLNPSFTITPVDGKTNTYVLQSDKNGPLGLKWDLGDGTGFAFGKAVDTVAYPDAGKYTIGLALIGKGGVPEVTTKDLNVLVTSLLVARWTLAMMWIGMSLIFLVVLPGILVMANTQQLVATGDTRQFIRLLMLKLIKSIK